MTTRRRFVGVTLGALGLLAPVAMLAQGPSMDPKAVVKRLGDGLGLLRSVREEDSMMTVEFWGTGSLNDGTRTYKLTKYYGAVAYDFPGMRIDMTKVADGGAPQREIHAVSGGHAWNEIGQLGGGLDPGYGSAEPAMATVNDRLLSLWTTPFGVYKTAVAAGANLKVSAEGGKTVLNYTLAEGGIMGPAANVVVGALKGTPVKVTLNAKNQPEKVEVRYGGKVIETTYSEYGDLNEKDYQADIFFPARIAQTIDGRPSLTLTVDKTNTYNPYIIVPVPANVQAAK